MANTALLHGLEIFMKKLLYGIIPLLILMYLCLPVYAECTPVVKIISSIPPDGSKNADPAANIVITWDKTSFELPAGIHDYKPILESINIAGGRYGLGTLLTTEWGIGGEVVWEENQETITPESPLEHGTQYKVWTYVYTSGMNVCPAYGGEISFTTSGEPPEDNSPVSKLDLTTIWHGNETGSGKIEGKITAAYSDLNVVGIKDKHLKKINIILYEGIVVMRNGEFASPSDMKIGDTVTGEFMGGRLYTITATGAE